MMENIWFLIREKIVMILVLFHMLIFQTLS
jgi:hypothetical protein